MELCYVWAEDFKSLKNFELNLSTNDNFKYSFERNVLNLVKSDYLPNDFYGHGISSVTGIFGENSSGKSNCLELICSILHHGRSRVKSDFIAITKDKKNKYQVYFKTKNSDLIKDLKLNFQSETIDYKDKILGIKGVYFSNVFEDDPAHFGKDVSNLSISTRNITIKEHFDFIKNVEFESTNFKKPEYVSISIAYPSLPEGTRLVSTETLGFFEKLDENIKKRIKRLDVSERLIVHIYYFLTFNLIYKLDESQLKRIKRHQENYKIIISNHVFHDIYELAAILIELLYEKVIESTTERMFDIRLSYKHAALNDPALYSLLTSFQYLKDYHYQLDSSYKEKLFDVEVSNKGLILNISNNYNFQLLVDFVNSGAYTMKWHGISSGHKAFLNLYSSIYSEIKKIKRDTIICIDEGDLYFHPKWQLSFFSDLISTLIRLNNNQIQIIITSHSPLILTDLPDTDVILLKKEGNKTIQSKDKFKSFGANLYDLYSHGFFLDDAKVGQFSYDKIQSVIKNLGSKTELEHKDLNSIVNIIGNDLISMQISRLMDKKND